MKLVASLVLPMLVSLATVTSARAAVSDDIRKLIESARGAPAPLCACAARAIYNGGWFDAPTSPLGRPLGERRIWRRRVSDEDVAFLLSSLDTPDACVRE